MKFLADVMLKVQVTADSLESATINLEEYKHHAHFKMSSMGVSSGHFAAEVISSRVLSVDEAFEHQTAPVPVKCPRDKE